MSEARLHDRMALVLEEGAWTAWMGEDAGAAPPAGRLNGA